MKIAIVAPKAYPVFSRSSVDTFGGAEVALSLIARELAGTGSFDVDVLVGDYGQPDVEQFEGISLHRSLVSKGGGLRNALRLFSKMKEVDADVYIQRALAVASTAIALYCRFSRRRFIYWVAHDNETDGGHPLYQGALTSPLVSLMFRLASHVIVQNDYEYQQLMRRFPGIACSMIKKGIDLPRDVPPVTSKYDGIWVGRCDDWKNPGAFVRLARQFKASRFLMVCPPAVGKEEDHEKLIASAADCENLEIVGRTAHREVLDFVSKSRVFCFTSSQEGDWPIVVLEAASLRKPILSLELNYDGLIDEFEGGRYCAGDFSLFAREFRAIVEDEELREQLGNGAFKYLQKKHNTHEQTAKLVSLLNELT